MTVPYHKWERLPTYFPANESPDGNERLERACQNCSLVKITVILPKQPPYPWRRWRQPGATEDFDNPGTPGCRGGAAEPIKLKKAA